MKEYAIYYLVIQPLYCIMVITRYFFLRFKFARIVHNGLVYVAGKVFASQPEHQRKFDALLKGMRGETRLVSWQRMLYESNPNCWKHFFKNIFARRLVVGSVQRRYMAWRGHVVPSTIAVSLNMPGRGCNLNCQHCYAKGHEDAEMAPSLFRKIIEEGEALGIYSIYVLGGEPFLYPEIWNFFREFPKTTFWVATNGTLLEREEIEKIASFGNVVPAFSLEGFKEETDAMRGEGVFSKVINAMKICGEFKIFYLASVTVYRDNFQVVTSKKFMDMLVAMRCIAVSYPCYTPVGADAHPEWQITNDQSQQLDQWGRQVMEDYPIFSTVGKNGTGRVNDCYAARQYLHILPGGQVEPCPFAHYASAHANIQEHGILGVTGSDFFTGVRYLHGFCNSELTPCRSSALLDRYFETLGAKKTVAN